MGDRGNIVMRYEEGEKIFLYTHWEGSDVPEILRVALAKRWRWSDAAYLARIIFDVMTGGSHSEETGFGIAPYMCDNEHDVLVVDCEKQEVSMHKYNWTPEDGDVVDWENPISTWSFEAFADLPEDLSWGQLEEKENA